MRFRIFITSVIGFFVTMLSSCLDNEPYPALYPTMGTVTDLTSYTINSDSYGILVPKNPDIIKFNDADSIGQRVLINVIFDEGNEKEKVSAKEVNIYELFKVLTKKANDLRTETQEDINDFGDAPIQIIPYETGAYISEEHLNLEFYINGHDKNIPHRISLLLTDETELDDEGLLRVELRHNNYSDFGNTTFWGIASFTLSSIPEYTDPDFKGFRIIYKNSDNSYSELKVLKPSDKNSLSRGMKTSEEVGYRHSLLSCELK